MMLDYIKYRNAWICDFDPIFEQKLTDAQCKELLRKGGWMVRNTYDFDCEEVTNFWYLIKDSYKGMEEISKNNRKKIRKALELLDFKLIDKSLVENEGYEIAKQTYDDYKVKDRSMNKNVFNNLIKKWDKKLYDFWGFFDKKDCRLIGFCVIRIFDNSCLYDSVFVLPEYRHNKSGVYYGKYFVNNDYYLGQKHFKYVLDGTRSVSEHSQIQPFLEQNFKFRKAYCKLKIRYKWWFGIIVRILYPFRKLIINTNVRAVLNMHRMQS